MGVAVNLHDVTYLPGLAGPINVRINDGMRVGVIGPVGCGKTTLLRLVAGLTQPTTGSITWNDGEPVPRPLGYMPQDFGLWDHLTVAQTLRMIGRETAQTKDRREAVIAHLQLAPYLTQRVGTLSGGERRRVALARALAVEAPLIILDEPFASLDYPDRDRFASAVDAIVQERGSTMLITSHLREEILALTTHGLILQAGELQGFAPWPDLKQASPTPFAAAFLETTQPEPRP